LKKRNGEQSKIVSSSKKIAELNETLVAEKQNVVKLETELANLKQEKQREEKQQEYSEDEIERDKANLVSSYEEKLNDLNKQMDLKERNLKSRLEELEQQLAKRDSELESLRLQVKNSESAQNNQINLRSRLEEAENKIKDLHKVSDEQQKSISLLKEEKQKMEEEIKKRESEVQTVRNDTIHKGEGQRSSSKQTEFKHNKDDLENLIATSKLAQQAYSILKKEQNIPIRFLSMRLGVSVQRCSEEIKKFEEMGVVTLEYTNGNESNPTVLLK
jgi:chromosome segregation ATPase